jgi:hypothetical protein
MTMSEMIELSENELEMIAGGQVVGSMNVQNNINVTPQVAIATAVLTENSNLSASNNLSAVQLNVAA